MTELRDRLQEELFQQPRSVLEPGSVLQTGPAQANRDRIAREVFGQETRAAETLGQVDLGPPGLEDPLARMGIAAGETFNEKLTAFQKRFPQGELVTQDGMLLFREDPSKNFARVDARMKEKFEPLGDFLDLMSPDIGVTIGSTLAGAIGTRGMNLFPMLVRMMGGAIGGEFAQESVEALVTKQEEPLMLVTGRAATKGLTELVGGALMAPVSGITNAARGAGVLRASEAGERALQAEARLGLKNPLTPGQVATDNPIVGGLERLSAAILPSFQRRFGAQQTELIGTLAAKGRVADAAQAADLLVKANDDMADFLVDQVRREVGLSSAAPRNLGGKALVDGIETFKTASQQNVTRAYKLAERVGTPDFDLRKARLLAGDFTQGAKGSPHPQMQDMLKRLNAIKGPKELPSGEVLSVTDQIRNIRTDVYSLARPDVGERFTAQHSQMNDLFNELTGTLKTPRNADPSFNALWQKANDAAAKRFDALDQVMIVDALRAGQRPSQLAKRLVSPDQADNLNMLRRTIPDENWRTFQSAAKDELLTNADNLSRRLDAFDKETLDQLLSPPEQKAFRQLGRNFDLLNDAGVKQARLKESGNVNVIRRAIFEGTSRQVDTVAKVVRKAGGLNSPTGKSVRAAIMNNIHQEVVETARRNGNALAAEQVDAIVKDALARRGIRKFLTVKDFQFFRDLKALAPLLVDAEDFGASLARQQTLSGLRGAALNPASFLIQLGNLAEHRLIGAIYLGKAGRKFMLGTGVEDRVQLRGLKILSGVTAELLRTDDVVDLGDKLKETEQP